jgi:glycerol kinase
MPEFVGAIDQGTTSTRFILFDRAGRIIASAQKEHRQIFPKPGWVEHDPQEIWQNTQEVAGAALARAGVRPGALAAVGITNQRETTVLWERSTGRPVHNALVWQDTRVDELVAEYQRQGGINRFRAKTGLPLASYFSGLKLRWLLDHIEGVRQRAEQGEVLFGNIDTWLLWNLTGGTQGGLHCTDVTNVASRPAMPRTPTARGVSCS